MSRPADAPLSHDHPLIRESMPSRRAERGLVLLEGRALALDVLMRPAAACEVLFLRGGEGDPDLVSAAAGRGVRVVRATERAYAKLAATASPPPVALLAGAPRVPDLDPAAPPGRLLVLQGVSDPGNAGTLVRAAAAFRFAVAFDGESSSPANEKFLRSTAGVAFTEGLLFRLGVDAPGMLCRVARVLALDARAPGTIAAALAARPPGPLAIVVGNESRGVDRVRWGDALPARIPMADGLESLNAAVSGAIAMYEAARSST